MNPTQTAKILIADRDRDIALQLQREIMAAGYDVNVACDSGNAAEELRKASYKVAIVEAELLSLDGALNQAIREKDSHPTAIILSAPNSNEMIGDAVRDGADAVCYRPFDISQLLGIIHQLACGDAPQAT